ncbi:MAG: ribosome silencing factor [Spirochaetaceae bacterium]|jgi:ribosome-associated protein|nr:ribosome silencing factor [Spirochaetaceae bacterium]
MDEEQETNTVNVSGEAVPENKSPPDKHYDTAFQLALLLDEHKGGQVVLIDLRPLYGWTDFFILATVTSAAQRAGLRRHIKDFIKDKKIRILNENRKNRKDDDWDFIDLGGTVIHLMTEKARDFYELERLWSDGHILKIHEGQSQHFEY